MSSLFAHLTPDLDELKALRARYERDLEAVTAEQAELQDKLDDLIAAAPSGVPLSNYQHQTVLLGAATRAAGEQFVEMIKGLLTFIDRSIRRKQILRGAKECVAESRELLASVRGSLFTDFALVAQSRKSLTTARCQRRLLGRLTGEKSKPTREGPAGPYK